jgi:D-beta-D-heptose 7-phosphate kinase/D-beta-D-heptose 1-phosphate adenosyltransferase
MYQKLLERVRNLGKPRILVAGDFMLDVYIYGDALRISPEAPVPVLKVTETQYCCGGAGSVAADIAALGGVPLCLGVVADDQNGNILRRKLTETGADTSGLSTVNDRPTITKQRLIGLAQHRHKQQLMRIDQESTRPLSDKKYDEILRTYKDNLPTADAVCLQDYDKGLLNTAICREMITIASRANKKVLVDPSPISDYSKYKGATLITPNRKETSLAVGFDIQNIPDAARAADRLRQELELEAVVITLDKEGAYLQTAQVSEHVPTKPRSVYDVTGAGDMVLAMLAVAITSGCDYKTAVQLSNIAGGIEVEKFGTATVTKEEIIGELMGQDTGKDGKLRTVDSLVQELEWRRRKSQKVVFTNGCFDVIHRGHIEYLDFCRLQGDAVVVGLNSDSSVKLIKGPDRPINNQEDRAVVLAGLESVDYIALFDEPDPLNLIKKVRPDVLVKGEDWADKGVVGREFVESYGGKVVLAPLVKGRSSTATIEKIKTLQTKTK